MGLFMVTSPQTTCHLKLRLCRDGEGWCTILLKILEVISPRTSHMLVIYVYFLRELHTKEARRCPRHDAR